MSMNKYNLYNLSRLGRTQTRGTYFQQKWKAKAATRAYHGEQIREKQWQRMFTSRIKSVIPMNHRYLAAFDGSEQAAGRGSGIEQKLTGWEAQKSQAAIPFMNMTFSPVERRLDTAIFRALFASSARQARQFVIHGGVKVNGKKVGYSGLCKWGGI
jgi:ribosomal protein S4